MQAIAVAPQSREVAIVHLPEPKISSPNDVKLRMLEAGVCGTDKEICAFEYGTPPVGSERLVIGHESLGEVVEIGPRRFGFSPKEKHTRDDRAQSGTFHGFCILSLLYHV